MSSHTNIVDILCLCTLHGVGGATLNAGLLTAEFERRGYRADLGFLFEMEPESRHGTESFFVIAPERPATPVEWRRFVADFKREVVGRRPRVIIGFMPMANVVGALAASRIDSCQMIATQRIPADRQSTSAGHLDRLIGSTRLYHANIAVSDTVATSFDAYPESYRRKLRVVHNATPALVEIIGDRVSCRKRFDMPSDRMVLGCLGRLHPQKNPTFALDVLSGLDGSVLFFAGDGELEAELRAKAKTLGVADRVTFLGSLDGEDITRFYRSLDALLFPSIYEGFGRVLVEAMSQGVPVVANDIPIVSEVGGDAVLSRPLDATMWVEALNTVRHDPLLAQRLRQVGIQRSALYALPAMVDGYLAAARLDDRPAQNPADS